MKHEWMRGCATALVTPFDDKGTVDVECLRRLVERQIAGGVRLLVPCGTTGESATMTPDEDSLVIETTVEVARERGARVIAGIGSNSTRTAISNAHKAIKIGVDGVLAVAPYYNKPTQAGLIAHFKAIADEIGDVPVMLYNVPGRTVTNIAASTTLHLAREVESIVAVKEASGNLNQIMEILRDRPAGFKVFSGDDAVTLSLLVMGADGLVSVASNEVPRQMSEMVEAGLRGDYTKARELHFRLLELMDANFCETSPAPVKAVMKMMGLVDENLRLPLVPVMDETRERLRTVWQQLGINE